MNYGYVRVSSRDQNEARQLAAMDAAGITKLYIDKQSGKDFERPKYKRLMKVLRRGDTLFVQSIDRLGRNYDEILEQWRIITKRIGADIVVLDMPLLDTRQKGADLTATFIADLVLQILSYVAQTEREFIKKRQRDGIDIALKSGVRMGRKFKPLPANYENVLARWENHEISEVKAAKELGVAPATFREWRRHTVAELQRQRENWVV